MMRMPGRSYAGPLPPLAHEETEIQHRLEDHVQALAGTIGERNMFRPAALEAAARHVEQALASLGYAAEAQAFEAREGLVRNIEAVLRGRSLAGEIVVVGAHYDSVIGSPGANDNASGTAAVLELARLLRGRTPARTVRFVLFVNEEPPFYLTEDMGSRRYAARARERGERIVAALSLETIGYYTDAEGSQRYPLPFSLFYPSRGNFVGFVGNLRSRDLVRRCVGSFRREAAFPSEGLAAPGWITGIGWSDHSSFWEHGYPGVMVTDTALFRYEPYHTAEDTPDRVRFDRAAKVVAGLARVVIDLAGP
jgi:Zn-dependent M28 family amino/carboxypeptidase